MVPVVTHWGLLPSKPTKLLHAHFSIHILIVFSTCRQNVTRILDGMVWSDDANIETSDHVKFPE